MVLGTLLLTVATAIVAASSCAGPAGGDASHAPRVVITEAPAGRAELHPEPLSRYPTGSRVLVVREGASGAPRLASDGLEAAGGVVVSFDGLRLLFVGRRPGASRHGVYSARADGSGLELLVGEPYDCGAAAFLPDSRVVFSARVEGAAPPGLDGAWALFVTATGLTPEQRTIERITFGASELDPAVLSDGRIVYSQWQPAGDGRGATGAFSIFTVHPDGTGAAPFSGYHRGPTWKLHPRQLDSGDVVYQAREPTSEPSTWRSRWSNTAVGEVEEHPLDPVSIAGFYSPDAGYEVIEATVVHRRARPQGHLSMIDPELATGMLLAIDARDAAGLAARARVRIAAAGGSERELGSTPLADDGSFFVVVPADVPLLVDVLDREGRVLTTSVTPIWVRPKEVRGCVGCHEDPDTAPPNRRPLAVLSDPIDLSGGDR